MTEADRMQVQNGKLQMRKTGTVISATGLNISRFPLVCLQSTVYTYGLSILWDATDDWLNYWLKYRSTSMALLCILQQ